ncbi:Serpentine Receptor, class J [Caenorhabditis elegans]|uniref:Serpentine Receptor, class J n=1 Tax=Caenorhabditis elegans TaxID=6239 RepID=E3CTG4_CAEEL|nr:Serpentine Receptor, class J [Caenorhabditis elegans]CCD64337.1 Serpentine Receptor, class J [Caenorhabditis elegans]|eukprot:NP_001256084.1 Serpentine Receptor, class J [Caenorhabditis elegans]
MLLLAIRCSLIACTYTILISHFVYRYLAVLGSIFINRLFPYFMIVTLLFCVIASMFWIMIAYFVAVPNFEVRHYIQQNMYEIYGADSITLNFFALLYQESTLETEIKSWIGVIAGSLVSILSIFILMILKFQIRKKLQSDRYRMSAGTAKMQLELLRSLVVQTVIPIIFSLAPCMLSWFTPMFNLKLDKWLNYTSAVPLSAFPFIDPFAVILCLPAFRRRLLGNAKPNTVVVSVASVI